MSGSEMATYEWKQIPWRKLEAAVFKLQRRIYRASQAGEVGKVHKLERLLLSSFSAKCMAVRRVTQDNQGKKTAGIDGVASIAPAQRTVMVEELGKLTTIKPLRRVWIPKPGKKEKRPLGIPTLYDRAMQALAKLALEPEWEAKFEPNSYGFRPGRSAHDAIGAIFLAIENRPKYVLDADIAKCFDKIEHGALLRKLGTFPKMRRLIKGWLESGVLDEGVFKETKAGTPQGGVISPLLANIALHGLEEHIQSQFPKRVRISGEGPRKETRWTPQVIRYADDLVVLHADKSVVSKCQELAGEWLKGVGLEWSEEKTRVGHTLLEEGGKAGFDFLGFTIRQHRVSRFNTLSGRGFKTLIKPSKESVTRHYRELTECIDANRAAKQGNLIGLLNPKIIGWSNYFKTVVSKEVFNKLDHHLHAKLMHFSRNRHPNKNRHWIVARYWKIDEKGWRFCANGNLALTHHADISIVRHVKVKAAASPFNGNWAYWASRRGQYPAIKPRIALLLKKQRGQCTECGLFFTSEALLEVHHIDGNHRNNKISNLALLHRHCHDQRHGADDFFSTRIGTYDKSSIN